MWKYDFIKGAKQKKSAADAQGDNPAEIPAGASAPSARLVNWNGVDPHCEFEFKYDLSRLTMSQKWLKWRFDTALEANEVACADLVDSRIGKLFRKILEDGNRNFGVYAVARLLEKNMFADMSDDVCRSFLKQSLEKNNKALFMAVLVKALHSVAEHASFNADRYAHEICGRQNRFLKWAHELQGQLTTPAANGKFDRFLTDYVIDLAYHDATDEAEMVKALAQCVKVFPACAETALVYTIILQVERQEYGFLLDVVARDDRVSRMAFDRAIEVSVRYKPTYLRMLLEQDKNALYDGDFRLALMENLDWLRRTIIQGYCRKHHGEKFDAWMRGHEMDAGNQIILPSVQEEILPVLKALPLPEKKQPETKPQQDRQAANADFRLESKHVFSRTVKLADGGMLKTIFDFALRERTTIFTASDGTPVPKSAPFDSEECRASLPEAKRRLQELGGEMPMHEIDKGGLVPPAVFGVKP